MTKGGCRVNPTGRENVVFQDIRVVERIADHSVILRDIATRPDRNTLEEVVIAVD